MASRETPPPSTVATEVSRARDLLAQAFQVLGGSSGSDSAPSGSPCSAVSREAPLDLHSALPLRLERLIRRQQKAFPNLPDLPVRPALCLVRVLYRPWFRRGTYSLNTIAGEVFLVEERRKGRKLGFGRMILFV